MLANCTHNHGSGINYSSIFYNGGIFSQSQSVPSSAGAVVGTHRRKPSKVPDLTHSHGMIEATLAMKLGVKSPRKRTLWLRYLPIPNV